MTATLNFDASQHEPLQPMTPLPRGRYNVMITDTEMKDTKSGTGKYLQIEFTVLDGDHTNRKCWTRLNLVNQNPTAEDIARRELSAICGALGVTKVADSSELHGRPLAVEVIVEKGAEGSENNRIKAYIGAGAAVPSAQLPFGSAPRQAAPAAPAKAAPPWAKPKAA